MSWPRSAPCAGEAPHASGLSATGRWIDLVKKDGESAGEAERHGGGGGATPCKEAQAGAPSARSMDDRQSDDEPTGNDSSGEEGLHVVANPFGPRFGLLL